MSNWEQVREIFADALETPPEDRGRFLDRTCTSDPELRLEVERLLADYEPASCLFQRIASTIGSFGSAPELEQGVVLANRFQIVRHLGSGGSADVYEVTDLELGERVALKRLRLGRITAEAEDRFRNEVRLARKIQSPHVCRVYDVGRTDIGRVETLFLTMELLDGETLRSRLRREGPLSEQAALPLLRQLASGLDAAHAIEILHRDFKSGNVILTQTGRGAVISDFGLALALETQTDSAVAAGTPAYMAPEQVEGKVLDRRADIYAFGVVMYEMVTGQLPFKGDTAAELARRRLSESPVPPRALRADLSERWERTILKCLSRKHVERFGSAGEVVAALNPLVGRRHVMAMALLSAAGIGTYVGGGLRSPSSEYSLAVLGFEAQQDLRYLAEALADDMAGVLSQIGSVKVLARASVMRLSEAQRSPAVMKELLGTSHVLTGKIRRLNGNRIRIVAELLNTAGSELAWSDSFEVSDGDVRRVGETICLAAMHSLRFRLPSAQVAAIETRHSKVPAALNSYLLGQYLAAKRDGPSLASSIEHYRNATTLDPQYALAYAGLGAAYTMITSKGIIARDEAFRQAEAMADQALKLNPALPEAHLVKGSNLQRFHWEWSAAEEHFRTAAKLAPQSAVAHHWYAGLLSMLGKHKQALAEAQLAKELDPLSPAVQAAYGAFLYRAGDHATAAGQLEWLVRREPTFANAHGLLSAVYCSQQRFSDCLASADQFAALSSGASFSLSARGYALARAGQTAEAHQIATELVTRYSIGKAAASEVAAVYLGLAETAQVFYWLDQAFDDRDDGLTTLQVDPAYRELRSDSRFQTLLGKLRFGG